MTTDQEKLEQVLDEINCDFISREDYIEIMSGSMASCGNVAIEFDDGELRGFSIYE